MQSKRVLMSVSDKAGLADFARGLKELGYEVISTGGTARHLEDAGIPVVGVSQVTEFPEILGGRLKTLHPKIHGGILARRNQEQDMEQLAAHHIGPIDLVVVNLYPFAQTIAREGVTLGEAIENIDIGGPTMVRAAAKNYSSVGVVVNPARYDGTLKELQEKGKLSEDTRFQLAAEAFAHTAEYDALISAYLLDRVPGAPLFKEQLLLPFSKKADLRYGENPQQRAAFYIDVKAVRGPAEVAGARQLQGKELSFNNYNDLHAAWEMALEFDETTVVAVKHTNPCGVASARTVHEAYLRAFAADPVSIFGGIVAVNRLGDEGTAAEMGKIFLEVVIAPDFSPEALEVFKSRKDLRLLKVGQSVRRPGGCFDYKKVSGGLLVQEMDLKPMAPEEWRVVTWRNPTREELEDLVFALRVVKHVKSNAIVLARSLQTTGIGAGQMNRVGAAKIAVEQAALKAKGSVMASDAFFPFKDTLEVGAEAGVTAIVQPGGSLKDDESIAEANKRGLAMLFTGRRYFKH